MGLIFKEKLAYGSAGMGDAASYTMVSTFLLFFLTTIVHIKPALAGTIIAVGSVWDAICSPVIGYCSDKCRSEMGRRRPFLLFASVPLAITTMLLFTSIDASMWFRVCYYGALMLIFWTAFSGFFVPYTALGAEFTHDYNERIVLRSYTSFFNTLGCIVGTVIPSMMVDILCSKGANLQIAWQVTGLFVGVISGLAVFMTFVGSKDKDKPLGNAAKPEKFNVKAMVKDYMEILKLKPMQIVVAASIISLVGITVINADRLYFFTYNMGLNAVQISVALLFASVIGFIIPPIINVISRKLDKRQTFILLICFSAVCMVLFKFITIKSMAMLFVMLFIYAVGNMTYWQLMPTMIYDVCEYDEYVNNKKRGGTIMSLQSLSEAVSEAAAVQILGIILQAVGFDGKTSVQTAVTMEWIETCLLIVPAVMLVIACIFVYKYPITKKKFEEIRSRLAERNG